MTYQIEITDTFGGEANYAWVKRFTLDAIERLANHPRRHDAALVRKAKKQAGWTGLRCRTYSYGDMIELRPVGRRAPCWIMFITWLDVAEG